jgi:hypothetical protein
VRRLITACLVAACSSFVVLGSLPASATAGGPPSSTPAPWTPQLRTDGMVDQVRQLVQCGSTMYAVGSFTSIMRYQTIYARNNAFSFSATDGTVSSWNPQVFGRVNSIALSDDCSTAYLGGKFTQIGSTVVRNIAAVSTTTGAVIPTFGSKASAEVATLLLTGGHLLVGGWFTGINGSPNKYLASLNPTTGKDDGYVHLSISGNYQYTDVLGRSVKPNPTRVYNLALSPDGTKLLAMGDFTSVGGLHRQQIFMLDLGATAATVDSWYSTEFDGYCQIWEAFYIQAASWSPDGSTIYLASTGGQPPSRTDLGPGQRTGLCDSASAFPSGPSSTQAHLWVNYTGCNSLYSTAADVSTAYFGGHEQYADNGHQCKGNADGTAVAAPGMVGLSPLDGSVTFNPTRARGLGADDMLVTSAGLWIASDNGGNANQCGGVKGHAGICFLPY